MRYANILQLEIFKLIILRNSNINVTMENKTDVPQGIAK